MNTTDFISEPAEQAKPLMDKAWRWLRSYFNWEDKNIDFNNEAELN
jgi:hypothetical protein